MISDSGEWSDPVERYLIPALERDYGPNHRMVHSARRAAKELQEEKLERVRQVQQKLEWTLEGESDDEDTPSSPHGRS